MSTSNRTPNQISTGAAIAIGFLIACVIFGLCLVGVSVQQAVDEAAERVEISQGEGVPFGTGEVHHIDASDVTRYLYVLKGSDLVYSQILNPGEDMSVVIGADEQYVVSEQPLAQFPPMR